ncbi:MAG: MerR family transcriptional regulator [Nitrospirae bacterium]|nr:MerR family transcriptional regulator [Nitrospirota bacterium]
MKENYTIQDLSDKTGFTRRTIRYYVQEGLIDPPAGRGRGGFYNDSHVSDLLRIKTFQDKGMNLSTIAGHIKERAPVREIHAREVWVKFEIVPGLEISVKRDFEEKRNKKITEIIRVAKSIMGEE